MLTIDNQNFTTPRAQATLGRILTALAEKPMTTAQLSELLHLSKPPVRRYLCYLMVAVEDKPRQVYVRKWNPTAGGPWTPVYALGSRKDVPAPKRLTKHEYNARSWQRIVSNKSKHEEELKRRRVDDKIRNTKKNPQTWMSALM